MTVCFADPISICSMLEAHLRITHAPCSGSHSHASTLQCWLVPLALRPRDEARRRHKRIRIARLLQEGRRLVRTHAHDGAPAACRKSAEIVYLQS